MRYAALLRRSEVNGRTLDDHVGDGERDVFTDAGRLGERRSLARDKGNLKVVCSGRRAGDRLAETVVEGVVQFAQVIFKSVHEEMSPLFIKSHDWPDRTSANTIETGPCRKLKKVGVHAVRRSCGIGTAP